MEKEEQRKNFRVVLGFKEEDIMITEEYSVGSKIKETFPNEIMIEQCKVLGIFVDFYIIKL